MKPGDNVGIEAGKPCLLTWPEWMVDRMQLDAGTVRKTEIRLAAIKFLLGLEDGSMAEYARQIGVSRNAISLCQRRLAVAFGLDRLARRSVETRRHLSAVASVRWAAKKKRADQEPPRPAQAEKPQRLYPNNDGDATTS